MAARQSPLCPAAVRGCGCWRDEEPDDTHARNSAMAHTVYCRTLDAVHNHLARLWCEGFGMTYRVSFPREALFPSDADGLVIDLDHAALTPFERLQMMRLLCMTLLPYPVALSSYDLEPATMATLQAKGV